MKIKELEMLGNEERKRKMNELKVELAKSKVDAVKTGGSRVKQIRKIIARMLTLEKRSEGAKTENRERKMKKEKSEKVRLSKRKISKGKS